MWSYADFVRAIILVLGKLFNFTSTILWMWCMKNGIMKNVDGASRKASFNIHWVLLVLLLRTFIVVWQGYVGRSSVLYSSKIYIHLAFLRATGIPFQNKFSEAVRLFEEQDVSCITSCNYLMIFCVIFWGRMGSDNRRCMFSDEGKCRLAKVNTMSMLLVGVKHRLQLHIKASGGLLFMSAGVVAFSFLFITLASYHCWCCCGKVVLVYECCSHSDSLMESGDYWICGKNQ